MVDLAAIRSDIAAVLTTAGIRAIDYVAETIAPPVAVVVPSDPYITQDGVPFGHLNVNISVLVIGAKGTNQAAAAQIDSLIAQAYTALNAVYDVTEVSPPGQVNLNGQAFLGAVLSISETTKA